MSLDDLRRRIDAIDDQLLDLLDERASVAHAIGGEKQRLSVPAHDPERERRVLERMEQRQRSRDERSFPESAVRAVFREIISACLAVEESIGVAFLGPPGTFTHVAAQGAFGLAARYVEAATIGGVFDAVVRGNASYGVVPIENSTEGGVTHTLDELVRKDVKIRAELSVDVTQCLVGRASDVSSIERVYSHPQALAQCREWLAQNLPHAQLVVSSSTSAAAREAAADTAAAAVASRLAAELAGLDVIFERIQDRPENVTRFIVIGRSDAPRTGRDKTSILFSVAHERGALRRALELLESAGLNLTRIESRPLPDRLWEYVFFTEFEGHATDPEVRRALTDLEAHAGWLKLLGSYPRAD